MNLVFILFCSLYFGQELNLPPRLFIQARVLFLPWGRFFVPLVWVLGWDFLDYFCFFKIY